jgi:PAS domain S-box-containing protein
VVAHIVKDKDGNSMGLRTSSRDITDFILARDHLRLSEARYKAVVESQSELIVRHTRDSTILYVNEAFTRFNGCKAEDITGMKWYSLVTTEVATKVEELMNYLSRDNPVASYEMLNDRFDGERRWISWISTGIFDGGTGYYKEERDRTSFDRCIGRSGIT